MHGRIPDLAGAMTEAAGLPRRWRRSLRYGLALVPLAIGVIVVVIAIVR
jgi:hypothetical protein